MRPVLWSGRRAGPSVGATVSAGRRTTKPSRRSPNNQVSSSKLVMRREVFVSDKDKSLRVLCNNQGVESFFVDNCGRFHLLDDSSVD